MHERDEASQDAAQSASGPRKTVSADQATQHLGGAEPEVERGAMPVPAPHFRCDLCRASDPEWCATVQLPNAPTLPLKASPERFDDGSPNLSFGPLVIGEHGVEWLLCEICCTFVEQAQWAPLVRRVVAAWEKRHERDADAEVQASANDLISRLRDGCFSDFQRL